MEDGTISCSLEKYIQSNSTEQTGKYSPACEIYFRASENGLVGTRELSNMTNMFEKLLKEKIEDNPELLKDIMGGTYQLCEEFERVAFFAGLKIGIELMAEL